MYEYPSGTLRRRIDPDGTITEWEKIYDFSNWPDDYYYEEERIGTVTGEDEGRSPVAVRRAYYDYQKGTLKAPALVKELDLLSEATGITRTYSYDWRNRLEVTTQEESDIVTRQTYDFADRVIKTEVFYDSDGSGFYENTADRLISRREVFYDSAGRVYRELEL